MNTTNNELYKEIPETNNYGQTCIINSITAYLIGVQEYHVEREPHVLRMDIYNKFKKEKHARIIHNLCWLRTIIERNFGSMNQQLHDPMKSFLSLKEIPSEIITELTNDGVKLKSKPLLVENLIEINKLITDRINNCQQYFPPWLNWTYYRSIFVMPDGLTDEGCKAAATRYYAYKDSYPYQMYINMIPGDDGNILYNDKKFLECLYKWNNDQFTDYSKVSDASRETKNKVYDFIDESKETVIVVDCENADPYKLCATLKNLDDLEYDKIKKIKLYDDPHTSVAWQILKDHVDIPIEHHLVPRVTNRKSLVDICLSVGVSEEFFVNHIDSFIIVSSDSDFWGLITALPDTRFLVMVERGKTTPDFTAACSNKGIFYCYTDEFYSGNAEDIKTGALLKAFRDEVEDQFDMNMIEALSEASKKARTDLNPEEIKSFYNKYIKNMRLVLDEAGDTSIEFNPLK